MQNPIISNKFALLTQTAKMRKMEFCGLRVKIMILRFVLQWFGAKRKIITFCRFISRNNVMLQIANSTWNHFYHLQEKVRIMHFRRVGIRYTAAEKAVNTLPKTDLPRKMWNWSTLCAFGCQNRNLWPKVLFCRLWVPPALNLHFPQGSLMVLGFSICILVILHQNHGNAPLECIFRFFAEVADIWCILWIL